MLILDVCLIACIPCLGFILSATNSPVKGLSLDSLSADSEDSTDSEGRSKIPTIDNGCSNMIGQQQVL